MGDHVVEMADGSFAEPVDVIGRRSGKTALHDDAVAVAAEAMANGAVDFEAFATAVQKVARERDGKLCDFVGPNFAGEERVVVIEVTAGDGMGWDGAGALAIGEEITGAKGIKARLVEHILAAGGEDEEEEK